MILDEYIRLSCKFTAYVPPFIRADVESDALFVSIETLEIDAVLLGVQWCYVARDVALGMRVFDFNDLCTQIGLRLPSFLLLGGGGGRRRAHRSSSSASLPCP